MTDNITRATDTINRLVAEREETKRAHAKELAEARDERDFWLKKAESARSELDAAREEIKMLRDRIDWYRRRAYDDLRGLGGGA